MEISSYSFHYLDLRFKGIVHKKMRIHSLSTRHYADGGVCEVLESTKHFWSLRGKLCCSQIQYKSSKWGLLLQIGMS